ncbi:DUF3592 domain-containing protein [Streptacidiphilus sp. P02-A3a]|uniref:DUF3592 domain-containing protein n=1 Tax=Streptacidiphilus sp. P02-A3a TaxID=2704468 RepID=UPI0015FC15C7|nr:DUF3592 domain-containing protein [Streptacidiphilus sp. P02-A3a]QMU69599.1 DUF3592 domain-containing protein [Streptacidiphilus sp. P02-A3a]
MDGVGVAGSLFGLVGFVFALIGIGLGVALVRGMVLRQQALTRGLSAEARCLDTFVARDADGGRHRRVVLGFTAVDGRAIRLTVGAPRTVVIGDLVQVRYLPNRPERAIVVGSGGPGSLFGTVIGVAACLLFTLAGLFVGAVGLGLGLAIQ